MTLSGYSHGSHGCVREQMIQREEIGIMEARADSATCKFIDKLYKQKPQGPVQGCYERGRRPSEFSLNMIIF